MMKSWMVLVPVLLPVLNNFCMLMTQGIFKDCWQLLRRHCRLKPISCLQSSMHGATSSRNLPKEAFLDRPSRVKTLGDGTLLSASNNCPVLQIEYALLTPMARISTTKAHAHSAHQAFNVDKPEIPKPKAWHPTEGVLLQTPLLRRLQVSLRVAASPFTMTTTLNYYYYY